MTLSLSDLIVQLQALEVDCGDHVVLMASDPEGNSFAALPSNFFSIGTYRKDGCFYEYSEEEPEDGEPADDPCICIWP